MSETIHCLGCGRDTGKLGNETPVPERCGHCPPWTCDDCGEQDSHADPCACWVSLEGMALADIKALFASDPQLSLDPVPEQRG